MEKQPLFRALLNRRVILYVIDNKKESQLLDEDSSMLEEHSNEIASIGFAYQNFAALAAQNIIDSQQKMIDAIPK